jgi:hypothetical protein
MKKKVFIALTTRKRAAAILPQQSKQKARALRPFTAAKANRRRAASDQRKRTPGRTRARHDRSHNTKQHQASCLHVASTPQATSTHPAPNQPPSGIHSDSIGVLFLRRGFFRPDRSRKAILKMRLARATQAESILTTRLYDSTPLRTASTR